MLKLFGRSKPDPDSIVTERWETKFFWKQRSRFREEQTESYSAGLKGRELVLHLKRKNLFAWVNNPLYRYRDFVLEADLELDPTGAYSSAGLIFRYVNESTYYYFLISTRGYFRFDVVFNGNPMRLIDWTELPILAAENASASSPGRATEDSAETSPRHAHKLLVVANGTRFTLCCDDQWIAEIDDESIDAGGIAFGVQNYNESDQCSAALSRLLIDSRGLEVETNHYRWREGIPVDPAARLRLARTLFAAENPTAAIIQIRKATRQKAPDAATLFFLAECQVALGLNESALENIERSIALDESAEEARREKANLLYLVGRYEELRGYLTGWVEESQSSTLWNLYGHAHYSLGRWQEALEAYGTASELEPDMPLFHINAARACDHLALRTEALDHYLRAGHLLLREDAIEDLEHIIPPIMALEPESREGRMFQGTVLFQKSDFAGAASRFQELVEEGVEDTAVFYMLGLIRSREGNKSEALPLFARAAELEPDFALYSFRLAETQYILGHDSSDAIARALSLGPDDPWILNLAGQIALDDDRAAEAVKLLSRAVEAAPEEIDIVVNFAESLFGVNRSEEAIALLAERNEPEAHNTLGNFYTRLGRSEEALASYERAYQGAPDNPIITENYAAACIESDLVNRAEELLGRLFESAPSASVLNRIANLARIEGDLTRAEAAYRECFPYLDLPDFNKPLSEAQLHRLETDEALNETATEVECNLAGLFLEWYRFDHARTMLERLSLHSSSPRVKRLQARLRSATEVGFACAPCGREWWAPRVVDVPSLVRLHGEPPADSPAGRCERCGKVYCVGCAVEHLREGRFTCPDCDEYLKLNNDHLKYLVLKAVKGAQSDRS